MGNRAITTAQPVAMIQLDPNEAAGMNKGFPVVINLSTGWFVFPPTLGSNVLKMARHGYGYEAAQSSSASSYSAPKLALKQQGQFCRMMQNRHCGMGEYTDTPKGDFIVDYHPEYDNLFIATGGSGHGFKFLPVLGRYIADSFEGSASEEHKRKWAWTATSNSGKGDGSRGGPPRRVLSGESGLVCSLNDSEHSQSSPKQSNKDCK